MEHVSDFEDMLDALEKHGARYLIVGGLAFVYHAKPRYTKDMDIWVDSSDGNVRRVNQALAEFGSPSLLEPGETAEILQVGVAPHRIDIMARIEGIRFETVWPKRIRDRYGRATANWMDMDSLIRAKQQIDEPRHREDVRVLLQVRQMRDGGSGPEEGTE